MIMLTMAILTWVYNLLVTYLVMPMGQYILTFCSAKLRDYEAATKSPTEVLPSYSKLSIHCPSGVLFFVSSMRELTV